MRTIHFPQRDVWFLEKQAILENMLAPGENLIHVAEISLGVFWKSIGVMLLGLIALPYGGGLGLLFLSLGLALCLLMFLTRKYLILAATDSRVIVCSGILNQEVMQFPYKRIESVEVLQTLAGQIFGYASIIIAGTGRIRIIVPFIRDGFIFADSLNRMLLSKDEPGIVPPEPLPPTTGEIA